MSCGALGEGWPTYLSKRSALTHAAYARRGSPVRQSRARGRSAQFTSGRPLPRTFSITPAQPGANGACRRVGKLREPRVIGLGPCVASFTRGYREPWRERNTVVALSVVLLLLDDYLKMSIIFWTIGLIVLVIGVVFLIVDQKSRAFGGRKYHY